MEKLKERWGISSTWQIIIILVVFSITGSSSVLVGRPVLEFIGLARMNFSPDVWGGIMYYGLRILIVFPIYQILLIAFGWMFGQFNFFWNFEKAMFSRMGFSRFIKQ